MVKFTIFINTAYILPSTKILDILFKMTDDHQYEIINDINKSDIIITSFANKINNTILDKKYIVWSGEPNPCPINKSITNIFQINTILDIPNSIYLPYAFDSPYWTKSVRIYNNTDRKYKLAYCNSKSHKHREDIFNCFVEKDTTKTCYSLGKCYGKYKNTNKRIIGHWTDIKLIEEYSNYTFVLAIENTNKPGYVTEKIMNAFASGAIPIYWGNKIVKDIFNIKSFIYVNDFKNIEDCVNYVYNMSFDDINKMKNEPIYNETDEMLNIHKYDTKDLNIDSLNFNNNFYNNIKNKITLFLK